MDRDRERDRERERRDDRYSNTYRPRSPAPARVDSYRAGRSPPRRGPLAADTYVPGSRASRPRSRSPSFRRRSRSPRRDEDRWRSGGRPRSPPRRGFSPRRDDFRSERARSPPPRREGYDSYTRSPRPRERSPPLREREASPTRSIRMRSPPRAGRYDEPRSRAHSPFRRHSPARDTRDFRRRSLSPRRERADPYTADTWRRQQSPSPVRQAYVSNDASGRESAATSRRSSPPPVHPTRIAIVPESRDSAAPRSPYRERDDRDRDFDNRDYVRERERSPPRYRDGPPTGPRGDRDFAPPTGPSASYRNGDGNFARAPPTGPSGRSYPSPAISPPAGPASSMPQPPAYPRGNNPVLAAPTRPRGGGRGGFGYGHDAPRDFSGPPPRRGSAHWGPRGGAGGFFNGPPSGPRGSAGGPPGAFAPPFRGSSNSTSTTYPRTQRFRDHLADLPKEVVGGQLLPDIGDMSRIHKLEEDMRKMREAIEAKEAAKRQNLKEWDTTQREADNAAMRSEIADQHLRSLNGESEVGGTAF
ncbi:hypothetical protein P154DRAFT_141128 [Amniculicola lignicola CBS 123094]|uniref:Serine/arginine repetitive matrix protein 1 n=1 Tax=Amniculicola lignicola CBS 123094 TaxID=1392246 RepID=A0A6A5WKY7_9PLEO|nr:hypothetical protein P154DRAFT_141128 [Amniculicola lignicola CBS 123094]